MDIEHINNLKQTILLKGMAPTACSTKSEEGFRGRFMQRASPLQWTVRTQSHIVLKLKSGFHGGLRWGRGAMLELPRMMLALIYRLA